MNVVILSGRLTDNPTFVLSRNGNDIAHFSIAVDRSRKREGQPDTDFFRCTAFGGPGTFAKKYLCKGMRVELRGNIQNDRYEKDGVKYFGDQIIVESIGFSESKAVSDEYRKKAGLPPVDAVPVNEGSSRQVYNQNQAQPQQANGQVQQPYQQPYQHAQIQQPAANTQQRAASPAQRQVQPQQQAVRQTQAQQTRPQNNGYVQQGYQPSQQPAQNSVPRSNAGFEQAQDPMAGFINIPDGIDEELPFA